MLQYCHVTATSLKDSGHTDLALRMFLLCAQGAGACDLSTITYEFFQQAFIIFEEDVSDSKAQFAAITLMIGVLRGLPGLAEEDRMNVIKNLSKAAAKLRAILILILVLVLVLLLFLQASSSSPC